VHDRTALKIGLNLKLKDIYLDFGFLSLEIENYLRFSVRDLDPLKWETEEGSFVKEPLHHSPGQKTVIYPRLFNLIFD